MPVVLFPRPHFEYQEFRVDLCVLLIDWGSGEERHVLVSQWMYHLIFLSHVDIERDEGLKCGVQCGWFQKMRKKNNEAGWILLLRAVVQLTNGSRVAVGWAGSPSKTQVTVGVKHNGSLMSPPTAHPRLGLEACIQKKWQGLAFEIGR